MQKDKFVILLTGCINPSGMKYTALQDPKEREKQYIRAIDFYLKKTSLPIVFCENTNSFIFSKYFKEYQQSGRYEFLTFSGNDYNKNRGKGYGEALIIEYAFRYSKLILKCESIIKITGRLIVVNINSLLFFYNRKNVIYAECAIMNKTHMCNSRFFISPKAFLLSYFLPQKEMLDDSNHYYFEHLLYDQILFWMKKNYVAVDIALPIIIEGVSGTLGTKFKRSRFVYLRAFYHYLKRKYYFLRNRNIENQH